MRKKSTKSNGVPPSIMHSSCSPPMVRNFSSLFSHCWQNSCILVCVCVDKTIKLWKIHEKKLRQMSVMESDDATSTVPFPRIPSLSPSRSVIAATSRRVFSNAHAYHINSISLNSDGETFLSADDLRLNWWNLEINDRSFSTYHRSYANTLGGILILSFLFMLLQILLIWNQQTWKNSLKWSRPLNSILPIATSSCTAVAEEPSNLATLDNQHSATTAPKVGSKSLAA